MGRALSPDAVERLFVRLSARVGFYVRPHMLRHSFASDVALATKDPALVKELLGHASVRSTDVYLHARWDDMRAAVDGHASRAEPAVSRLPAATSLADDRSSRTRGRTGGSSG